MILICYQDGDYKPSCNLSLTRMLLLPSVPPK